MSQEQIQRNVQGLLRWLLGRAKQGDEKAIRALEQIPEVLAKVRANRAAGRVPVRR